jgi:CubicO group peptidase (beta-lactamase class C family)
MDDQPRHAEIDAYLQAQAGAGVFSGCVLIAKRGVVSHHAAYGLASIEHAVSATIATRYKIFSVTKPITALAILLLVQAGAVGLDAPVAQYLPDCPSTWHDLTLAHLLSHTSGLPELTQQWGNRWNTSNLATLPHLFQQAAALPLTAPPGSDVGYNNVGYELLGCIIEAVSGQTYPTFVQERIFAPLGMHASGVEQPQPIAHDMYIGSAPVRGLATGYNGMPGFPELAWSQMYRLMAAGGVYATASDLALFFEGLRAGELLRPDLLVHCWTPAPGTGGLYGYGWMLRPLFGRPCIRHDGGNNGFMATLDYYPDEQLTFVVLSNYGFLDLDALRWELLSQISGAERSSEVCTEPGASRNQESTNPRGARNERLASRLS